VPVQKYFGEVALLENKERNADVFAQTKATTFALNRTEFNKIFGVHGQQYKSWYKAVRDLQKELIKSKNEDEDGVLGLEHVGKLKGNLKKAGVDMSAGDFDQICKNLINDLGQDITFETSENDFIATMLADEKRDNFAKFGELLPGTPVSFLVIAGSITAYIYDTLTSPGCDLPEETGPLEYNCRSSAACPSPLVQWRP
jgi:hypothetical protein